MTILSRRVSRAIMLSIAVVCFAFVASAITGQPAQAQQLTVAGYLPAAFKSIEGRVTTDLGAGLKGVEVTACRNVFFSCEVVQVTTTNAEGEYAFYDLPNGQVYIKFGEVTTPDGFYQSQFWNNVKYISSAKPVTIASGVQQTGINAVYRLPATLGGKLTNKDGTGISGVTVELCRGFDNDCTQYESVDTASDGTWEISGLLPGNFRVLFNTDDGTRTAVYESEYFNQEAAFQSATGVVVGAGEVRKNINAKLRDAEPPYQVGGRVTDYEGNPLAGIETCVADSQCLEAVTTDANGVFTATIVAHLFKHFAFHDPANVYKDVVYPPLQGYFTNGAMNISSRNDLMNINLKMSTGSVIRGSFADWQGNPLDLIEVEICKRNPLIPAECDRATEVSIDGATGVYTYAFTGLTEGDYRLLFSDDREEPLYAAQYYNAVAKPQQSTWVTLAGGETVIDVRLFKFSTITGKIFLANGDPAPNANVNICYWYSGYCIETVETTTNSSGVYGEPYLFPSEIRVAALDSHHHETGFYGGGYSWETAGSIFVEPEEHLTGIDVVQDSAQQQTWLPMVGAK